ncbi:MAG TPA: winged helix-turn-helix domain-containing protein [Noviherbaspirillum sp.]|jgi:DNA-binding transcriptional ArsR family regulator|uniref:winged helix-turn-helix domain-containing protein n=1 Tax=Noviherbaspirillum sp. TaxID=1926288 RepID=UPI002F93CA93
MVSPIRSRKPIARDRRLQQLEAILVRDMSYAEAAAALGISESTTRHYLDRLRDVGRVYVSGWRRSKTSSVRLFRAGHSEDVPRPDLVELDDDAEPPRAPTVVDVRRDPLVAALFGGAV